MHSMSTATKKKLMVKKRSGRFEPFDSRKMARATGRAGVPYSIALGVAKAVKNNESLAGKEDVSSVTLRKIVAEELRKMTGVRIAHVMAMVITLTSGTYFSKSEHERAPDGTFVVGLLRKPPPRPWRWREHELNTGTTDEKYRY